jgi:hypothetical protein
MERAMTKWRWGIVVLLFLAQIAHAAVPDAAQAFQRLSGLVGAWKGVRQDGHEYRVDYRLSAGGTVVVETWTLAPGRESMTLYHRDGAALLATHYCPQGNQPRLQLGTVAADGTLSFTFRDGTNLQAKDKSHQRAFWIRVEDDGGFSRSETYVDNSSTPAQIAAAQAAAPIVFHRID